MKLRWRRLRREPEGGSSAQRQALQGKASGLPNAAKQWELLCQARPGPMLRCYAELADHPFPRAHRPNHYELKGKLTGTWQYKVGQGERVWYQRGEQDIYEGEPIVVYAGPHPPATG